MESQSHWETLRAFLSNHDCDDNDDDDGDNDDGDSDVW